jgi:DNA mismatch repair protein MSH6
MLDCAAGLPDLERIVSRIHAGSCPILTFLSALDAFDLLWVRLVSLVNSVACHR